MAITLLGALMVVCGFASAIYGHFMNNEGDPGTTWIIFGITAIILGVCSIISGAYLNQPETSKKSTYRMIFFCKKCKSTYGADSGTKDDCPNCGTRLIETQTTCDYWRSLSDAQKELERQKFIQDTAAVSLPKEGS